MELPHWIVIAALGLPLYSYVIYPIVLFCLSTIVQVCRDLRYLLSRQDRRSRTTQTPSVSIIMSAFNEEEVIGDTLRRCLELEYPADRLEILVGSDGSTDQTVEVAKSIASPLIRVFDFPNRRGKAAVVSGCVREASGDLLVFTDANTLLARDALQNLIRHFDNPRVGAVCGELRLVSADGGALQEGFYWRYEVVLKILESRLHGVLGANGAIYALRRELFPQVADNIITDDFVIPMKVQSRGLRVVYDPEAVATEQATPSVTSEFRRRVRIGAGNWQALWHCAGLLLPWKGFVSFAFWSHKVLRWFTPYMMITALVANVFVLHTTLGRALLTGQLAFYATAGLGYLLNKLKLPTGPLSFLSYFVAINTALGLGLARGAFRAQRAAWRRTDRSPSPTQTGQ